MKKSGTPAKMVGSGNEMVKWRPRSRLTLLRPWIGTGRAPFHCCGGRKPAPEYQTTREQAHIPQTTTAETLLRNGRPIRRVKIIRDPKDLHSGGQDGQSREPDRDRSRLLDHLPERAAPHHRDRR